MNLLSSQSRPRLPTWPSASLRTYLVIVILLATVPIATLMSFQIFRQVSTQRATLQEEIRRGAAVLAQSVNRELLSSIDALNILSYSGEIQNGDVQRFEQALLKRPLLRESWSGIYLVSLDGEVLFNTAHPGRKEHPKGYDVLAFLRRVQQQPAVISDLFTDRDEARFTTTVEVPVLIDGVPHFILGVTIPASVWQQLAVDSGLAKNGVLAIIDRNQRMITRSRMPERYTGMEVLDANQALMRKQPVGTGRLASFEGGYLYAAWDTAPLSSWRVFVAMPAEPVDQAHLQDIAMALATAGGCLLLGVFLALLVARRMTAPLHRLASNDLAQPTERIAVREISMLRDSLVAARTQDEMTRALIRKKRDLLEKKADEFETLLASSPIGLAFAQDRLCRTVTHNAAMDTLFGTSESEDIGTVTVLHEGRTLPREQQPLQRAAAYGEATRGMELEIRVEGRPPAFVIVNAVPLRDEDGQPRGAIGAVVDITERKAGEARLISAEQRLRESQHLVDLAQETGHVGFFHYQLDDHILAWTPGQAKLFGLFSDEAADSLSRWTQRIDRADWRRIVRVLRRAFANGLEMENVQYCVTVPDGPSRWLSSRIRLIYTANGKPQHVIGVTVDMTEQKNAERERDALIVCEQAARIEAEAANRSKDEFLAMLGHELRNPLSAIASGVEVLNRVDGSTDVAVNARRIIGRQTRHLAHMMDDLLDVARVMTGRVELPRHSLDLGALVERVISTLQITGEFHDHELVPDIHEAWIKGNATRIEQVVNNLLINAIKYTPPGGRIDVRVVAEGTHALMEIKDNGVGIDPVLLPRVFDLFVQGERTLDRRSGGLGVGLTLVRRLVELHEGTITAANADPGTIMSVRLPAIEAPTVTRVRLSAPASRHRRVAVVEDNADVIEGLRTVLQLEGHTVWTAVDGISGLEVILSQRPDVAVVDIGLPGLTGYEVAKRSRAGGYAGKMIALSGYGQDNDRQGALAAGFDAHLLKPVTSGELLKMIDSD